MIGVRDSTAVLKLLRGSGDETTTADALRRAGVSRATVESFFAPFLRGIFLAERLLTSSRFLDFVLRAFSDGPAALPAGGIPDRDQDRHIMIAAKSGNITNLRVNCAGSRPATKSLAVTATWATAPSRYLRSIPILPTVIVRSRTPTFSIVSANRVQPTSDIDRQRRNPHSV